MSTTSPHPPASAPRTPSGPNSPDPAGRRPSPAPTSPGAGRSSQSAWPLLIRLHFYAGILVAPFLIVAAATGLAYAVTPQLDSLLYGDKLHVSSTSGTIVPIDEQVRAAQRAYPGGTLATVATPVHRNDTTRVVLNVPELGAENQQTVFVDPYTGVVKGQLTTWYGDTPTTTWLDALHRNLHLGAFGRNYSELAASWLWVIAGGGLLIWLGRPRTYRSGKLRHIVVPNLAPAKGVRRTRNWHASTGVWLIVGLFFLSATGLTWSNQAGARFSLALDALNAHAPELDTSLPNSETAKAPAGHHPTAATTAPTEVDPAEVASVLTTARAAGLEGPLEIAAPPEPGSAWSATQTDNVWPVRKDQLAIDPAQQQVTARNDWADYPFVAKLTKLGIKAHMGVLFGLINELLLVALMLGLICVTFWGYRMWWQRRPTRTGRRRQLGRTPSRGTWRPIPRAALAAGGLVTAGLCWAMPLFGWTLVAFLLADLYIAEFQRQRDLASRELI